jgi:hypothetical protein
MFSGTKAYSQKEWAFLFSGMVSNDLATDTNHACAPKRFSAQARPRL